MTQPLDDSARSAVPWNVCATPGCAHNGCAPKVRAWGGYGRRYICAAPGCVHVDCAARLRSQADGQPFGQYYRGPALS